MSDKTRQSSEEWERILQRYERDVLEAYEREANPNDATFLSLAEREPSPPRESADDAEGQSEQDGDGEGDGVSTHSSRVARTSSHLDADRISDEEAGPPPAAAASRNPGAKSRSMPATEPSASSARNQRRIRNAGRDPDLDDWDVSAITRNNSAIQETTQSTVASQPVRNQKAATAQKQSDVRGATGRRVIPETDTELESLSQVRERSGSVDLMDLDDNLPNTGPFARPQKVPTRTTSTTSTASSTGVGSASASGGAASRGSAAAVAKKSAPTRDDSSVDLTDVPSDDDDEDDNQPTAPSKAKRSRVRPAAAAPSSRRGHKQQVPNSSTLLDDSSSSGVANAADSSPPSRASRQGAGRNISMLSFLQPPGNRPPLTSTQKSSYALLLLL